MGALTGRTLGPRVTDAATLLAKVDKDGPVPEYAPHLGKCWIWQGYVRRDGYGAIGFRGRPGTRVHRAAYELLVGPIPHALHIDHLCRVPRCVNPAHLEPVTPGENARRGGAAQTHCKHGHEFTELNIYITPTGARSCRACNREAVRTARSKRKGLS